jgi:hypothetical protein
MIKINSYENFSTRIFTTLNEIEWNEFKGGTKGIFVKKSYLVLNTRDIFYGGCIRVDFDYAKSEKEIKEVFA